MKAVLIHGYGTVDVLRYEDVPNPQIRANEVLIKVHAAGVNPVDYKIREGNPREVNQSHLRPTFPAILGMEAAGTIERVGSAVGRFKQGDAVCFPSLFGAYAEYIAVKTDAVAFAPKSIPLAHAAAVPVVACSAWTALFDGARLGPGSTVLIENGSGGVGNFAIQLAKLAGLRVYATSSAANLDLLKSLGADLAIDYRNEDVVAKAKNVDGVIDLVGGPTLTRAFDIVRKGGVVISMSDIPDQALADARGVRAHFFPTPTPAARIAEACEMIDGGKIKVIVGREFPLAEAAAAHLLSESGRSRGKTILRMV
jgi:NADPH:quinone reductase-like Zn-dependent oxidoreductase